MTNSSYRAWAIALTICALPSVAGAADDEPVLDDLPAEQFKYIEQYNNEQGKQAPQIEELKRKGIVPAGVKWVFPNVSFYEIKVAFPPGGDEQIYKLIEEAAREWINRGEQKPRDGKPVRLRINFKFHDADGKRFTWTPFDWTATADIRVGFDDKGYYSQIGTINRNVPGIYSTMNLQGFDRLHMTQTQWKASYEKSVVLHEFGHVLGFAHEQFHEKCQRNDAAGFKWNEDMKNYTTDPGKNQNYKKITPGTRRRDNSVCAEKFLGVDEQRRSPGIYLQYWGAPNCWTRKQINFQFKRDFFLNGVSDQSKKTLIDGVRNAIRPEEEARTPDQRSVMLYRIPEYLFVSGMKGACFTSSFAVQLSDKDVCTLQNVYGVDNKGLSVSNKSC